MASKWELSVFPGVRYRNHPTRKRGTKFDHYFAIRYQLDGRRIEEGLGWASEGMTAKKAYGTLNDLMEAAKLGGAATLRDRRTEKARMAASAQTLEQCIELFLADCSKRLRDKTVLYYRDGLTKLGEYEPVAGAKELKAWPMKDIKRMNVKPLIDAAKSPAVGRQLKSSASALFSWAVENEIVDINPVLSIKAKLPGKRSRTLSDDEIGILWRALDKAMETDDLETAALVKLTRFIFSTGCRLSEALGLHASEIATEEGGVWWTIPAARFKGKRDHRVYLTPSAAALVEGSARPFRNPRTKTDFDASSIARFLKRVGYFGLVKFNAHDARRTLGTALARNKFRMETVSVVLGHKLTGVTAESYVTHTFDDEKKEALTFWAAHVLRCAAPEEALAEVVAISSRRA